MLLILDRIEEGIAVLTDGSGRVYECPSALLPEGSGENSALETDFSENGEILSLTLKANPNSGENSRRLRELFRKSSGRK